MQTLDYVASFKSVSCTSASATASVMPKTRHIRTADQILCDVVESSGEDGLPDLVSSSESDDDMGIMQASESDDDVCWAQLSSSRDGS